jgi:hypothetical protein
MAAAVAAASLHPDQDTDPRELEAFAERFKQRRIKLGKYKFKVVGRWEKKILQSDNFDLIQLSMRSVRTVDLHQYRLKLISQENLRMKLKKENFHLAKIEMLLLLLIAAVRGQF